ncbi:MAG TPA: Ig-like domain-containing protein [Flavitalea sp.]|nr:Ig-like domain-containing protein [Flavitalea sp.]
MRTLLLPILACMLFISCQRKIGDFNPPVITFISPEDESIFSSGGTVIVRATITDDIRISEVHLDVMNVNLNQKVFTFTTSPKELTYELDQRFTTTYRTRYEIAVEAEDLDGNVHREKIYVSALQ